MSRGYKRVEERAPDVSCGDRIFWLRLCPCENCSLLGMGVTLGSASAHEPSPQARGPPGAGRGSLGCYCFDSLENLQSMSSIMALTWAFLSYLCVPSLCPVEVQYKNGPNSCSSWGQGPRMSAGCLTPGAGKSQWMCPLPTSAFCIAHTSTCESSTLSEDLRAEL